MVLAGSRMPRPSPAEPPHLLPAPAPGPARAVRGASVAVVVLSCLLAVPQLGAPAVALLAGTGQASRWLDAWPLLALPAWAATTVWLVLTRHHAGVLGGRLQHHPAWAWLAWVVPLVSLVMPKLVVDDCRRALEGHRPPTSPARALVGTTPWWIAWLGYLAVGGAAVVWASPGTPVADGPVVALLGLEALVAVVALVLWLRVVRRLTRAQLDLAGR